MTDEPSAPPPFFVYGTLQPTELAFRRIAPLVAAARPAELADFGMFVRDGLPGLQVAEGARVHGYLLYAVPEAVQALRETIRAFEPKDLYAEVSVTVARADGTSVKALTHKLRKDDRGAPEYWDEDHWTCAEDPLFLFGLPQLTRSIALAAEVPGYPDSMDPRFWTNYLPILGQFLALCGVLERYLTLAYAPSSVWSQLGDLGDSDAGRRASERAPAPSETTVFSTDRLDAVRWAPGNEWRFWYQVRSNAVHRGKAAFRDADLVATSAVGLSTALTALLGEEIPGLQEAWRSVGERGHGARELPWQP